jgi:hypothetical protein
VTLREIEINKRRHAASLSNPSKSNPIPPFQKMQTFAEWCRGKNFSLSTGRRLRKAGKVKVIQLSPRRLGVTEEADREYLESCESA